MTSHMNSNSLTKYRPASTSEVWNIAYPLMLTALSANLMLFMDRLLLSRYMPLAMAAVTTIGMIFTIFQFAGISVASIAEVFVGKYNGANTQKKIGPLVWQMIWFSIFSALVFIPVGLFCGEYFIPVEYYEYGIPYFKTIMFFGPVFPLVAALSSFFIGQGNVKLVTVTTILVNFVNIIFCYFFIFGIANVIPPLGTFGAALAGGLSISMQAIILFYFFLKKENRIRCATTENKFIFSEFWHCIRVGVPNAVGHLIEMTAWAYLLQIMVHVDNTHIVALSIGQTLFLLLAFTTDGLQKSIIAIASNSIGAQRLNLISILLRSGVKVHLLIVAAFAIPLLVFPDYLVSMFFDAESQYSFEHLMRYAQPICLWVLIYFIFDGLVWVCAGILTAFEDTVFVMIINIVNVWLFAVLPNYIAVKYFDSGPDAIWQLMSIYALINAACFAIRYIKKIGNFKNKEHVQPV